ncbi:MAG TPA: exo-alpha-sialidase [Vicinamibacteria bacterium]|nr:exo-alpha-sialidase [Vicinamibacteria bacterium]
MAKRIYIGTRKGLFAFERESEGKWTIVETAFLGDPVPMVLPDRRDDVLYAALDLGHFGSKLRRSRDSGKSWQEVAIPEYPSVEGDEADRAPALKLIWCLEAAGDDSPGSLWAGTAPGGLFRSDDRGETWQLNAPLWEQPDRAKWFGGGYDVPGIHSICVDPEDSKRVVVGVSCGGVWITENAGSSWRCSTTGMYAEYMPPERREDPAIQDPHRIVQCRSAKDTFWAQHHNGVFRSENGGASWQEIHAQPSSFGFAAAIHPDDPDTAWLVPLVKDEHRVPVAAAVVVARTRDGGRSFEVLRQGLPQEHAYDVVFRHGLDVDGTGDLLAMGSTTGSLWVSEDQGESWQTLSTHLPPIYVVRFGPG